MTRARDCWSEIEELGVQVHLQKATREILGNGKVEGIQLADFPPLPVEMVVVSAGIRPRDELARNADSRWASEVESWSMIACGPPMNRFTRSARSPCIAA